MELLLDSLREQVNSLQERLCFCRFYDGYRSRLIGSGQCRKGKGVSKTQQISSKEQVQEGGTHLTTAIDILNEDPVVIP